jgi:hypothetical protein
MPPLEGDMVFLEGAVLELLKVPPPRFIVPPPLLYEGLAPLVVPVPLLRFPEFCLYEGDPTFVLVLDLFMLLL